MFAAMKQKPLFTPTPLPHGPVRVMVDGKIGTAVSKCGDDVLVEFTTADARKSITKAVWVHSGKLHIARGDGQ